MATIDEELEDLDAQYKRNRQAILLKYAARNDKKSAADPVRTKELIKQLMTERAACFAGKRDVHKLEKAIEKIESGIGLVESRMEVLVEELSSMYPERCKKCGLPDHEYTLECEECVDYDEPLSYYGNRFWWDVEFTPEEVVTIADEDNELSVITDIMQEKNKLYPLYPDLLPK